MWDNKKKTESDYIAQPSSKIIHPRYRSSNARRNARACEPTFPLRKQKTKRRERERKKIVASSCEQLTAFRGRSREPSPSSDSTRRQVPLVSSSLNWSFDFHLGFRAVYGQSRSLGKLHAGWQTLLTRARWRSVWINPCCTKARKNWVIAKLGVQHGHECSRMRLDGNNYNRANERKKKRKEKEGKEKEVVII